MASTIENDYIRALDVVLSKRYTSPMDYSLKGYSEGALCLEKDENKGWCIYSAERGKRNFIRYYDMLLTACLKFLSEIAISEKNTIDMRNEYLAMTIDDDTFLKTA